MEAGARVITRLDELAPAIFLDMFGQYSGDFMTVEEVAERQKDQFGLAHLEVSFSIASSLTKVLPCWASIT